MHKLLSVFSMNEIHGEMNVLHLNRSSKLEPIYFTGHFPLFLLNQFFLSFHLFIFLAFEERSILQAVGESKITSLYLHRCIFLKGSGGSKYSVC